MKKTKHKSLRILLSFIFVGLICFKIGTNKTNFADVNIPSNSEEIIVSLEEKHFSFRIKCETTKEKIRDIIVDRKHYKIFLNEKQIDTINLLYVDLENVFNFSEQTIVVLSVADGGNNCPKRLKLITFYRDSIPDKKDRLILLSSLFGNCHETPSFIVNFDSIKINFPYGNNPIAESWLYDGTKLTEIKPRRK